MTIPNMDPAILQQLMAAPGMETPQGPPPLQPLEGALPANPEQPQAPLPEPEATGVELLGQSLTDDTKAALQALYGSGFPLVIGEGEGRSDALWASWVSTLWTDGSAGVRRRLHEVQRNRLMRQGFQWVASRNGGPWREPPRPNNAARVVYNMISPALDQREQLVSEQRPGFQTRPATQDTNDQRKAEAQQIACEYQYEQQGMQGVLAEAVHWAGTDGVSFTEQFWNPDAGPWDEVRREPLGEVDIRVHRMEQVRVSPNATANRKPYYTIIREIIPRSAAVLQYGARITSELSDATLGSGEIDNPLNTEPHRLGLLQGDEPDELMRDTDTVSRYTIYCERNELLPEGLTCVVVGDVVAFRGPLLFGCTPVVRWTDGSTDPAYFCRPVMNRWLDSQMRVNAVLSKWVENVRLNAGPKLLGSANRIKGETLIGGTTSLIEVNATGPISEAVQVIPGFSLAPDAERLLMLEKKAFEDLTGWNDTSRGSLATDTSGRAILAIREQLERVFAPLIRSTANSMSQWAKISLKVMAWGYDEPRRIAVTGSSRPDLARALGRDDLDGAVDVWVDGETLSPMPKSLKLFLLKDLMQMGVMTPQDYQRRLPFAFTRNLNTPDTDQFARAMRCAEALRRDLDPPIYWQDNEAIHQDVLERELIFPDDTDPMVRAKAVDRWTKLANQSARKQGAMMPPAGPGGQQPQGAGPQGASLAPSEQPFAGTLPGVAAQQTSIADFGGGSDESRLALTSDRAMGV